MNGMMTDLHQFSIKMQDGLFSFFEGPVYHPAVRFSPFTSHLNSCAVQFIFAHLARLILLNPAGFFNFPLLSGSIRQS